MNKLITLSCAALAFFFLLSCNDSPTKKMSYNQGINIIPAPLNLEQQEGSFTLNKNTTIYAAQAEAKNIAEFFALKIRRSTGLPLPLGETQKKNTILLMIDNSLELNDEGYTLTVSPKEVIVKGKTPQGLYYGMQSFMQLLPAEVESPILVSGIEWSAPSLTITDEPRFGWRGIHLDPCRHFMTVEEVKKQLDVLSLFKINTMHWHLTDDQAWRIEIKQYPKLTEIGSKRIEGEGFEYGGYYTQEEIKEVVQYAAERFITVIPEIELPGHGMAAIAAYPELSCKGVESTPRIIWGVEDVVFCAGKEETYVFLENVFKEVIELFPSEIIHIGGDECPKSEWKQCPLCQKRIREEKLKAQDNHTAEERLQSYFVQRMEKVLAKYGKKIIGWDEILEGGLAPTAMVMSWRGEQGGIAAAGMGHDVVMTPQNDGMYLDRFEGDAKIDPVTIGGSATIETVYKYNPVPATLVEQGKEKHILGVQCNTWSEYMYTNDLREYRIYPRILALAEIGWTALERKDYKDFERRIDNACVRLDGHDINYYIPLPEQPGGSCNFVAFTDKATLAFTTSRPIKVVYTTDGTEPTSASTIYETPLEFTESGTVKIRSVLPSGKMSPVRTITVEKQKLAPAVQGKQTRPGLEMEVTYGYFLDVDQLEKVKGWKSSTIPSLRELTQVEKSSESMRGVKQYAAIAKGYIHIPEDGVYYVSSDNEEVWIDGKLIVNNRGEVKRFSRNDRSLALQQGLHELKVVFLGHIIGGWPSNWNNGSVSLRKDDAEKFTPVTPEMLSH